MRTAPALGPAPLFLAAALLAAPATAEPRLLVGEGRWLVLTELPMILEDDAVRPHLESGLTTTFLLRAFARGGGGRREGGARIEIRYALWDEEYHVAAIGVDGLGERRTLASAEALRRWWSNVRVALFSAPAANAPRPDRARLTLEVVPFSRAEESDTQRWFTESIERSSRSSTEEVSRRAEEGPDTVGRLLALLMATSISTEPVTAYRWTVPWPAPR